MVSVSFGDIIYGTRKFDRIKGVFHEPRNHNTKEDGVGLHPSCPYRRSQVGYGAGRAALRAVTPPVDRSSVEEK